METFCRYFNQGICRSCDLLQIDYPAQISLKENLLRESLKEMQHPPLEKSVLSSEQKFRNKAKFSVTGDVNNPIIGLTGEDELDQGRELLNCPLHVNQINNILTQIKSFITKANLVPYKIEEKKGELKGLILYYSEHSDQGYIRFIMRSKESIDRMKKHASLFDGTKWKSISANIQPIPHAILEGPEEVWITTETTIENKLGNFDFTLSPQGFVQTNQGVAEKLYQEASDWIKDLKINRMLELFSGQGPFSFFASDVVHESLGIEINKEAVESANAHALKVGKTHLKFVASDAAVMKELSLKFDPDLVLVNPPRRGLGESINILNEVKSKHLIYSSCNYQTLAKDLVLLKGYKIERIKMFDMFPHTKHFETLVLLRLIERV